MGKEITAAVRNAVVDQVGYDSGDDVIEFAVAEYAGKTTEKMRGTLDALERQFKECGGRGSHLAARIDALRIALAVRQHAVSITRPPSACAKQCREMRIEVGDTIVGRETYSQTDLGAKRG